MKRVLTVLAVVTALCTSSIFAVTPFNRLHVGDRVIVEISGEVLQEFQRQSQSKGNAEKQGLIAEIRYEKKDGLYEVVHEGVGHPAIGKARLTQLWLSVDSSEIDIQAATGNERVSFGSTHIPKLSLSKMDRVQMKTWELVDVYKTIQP